jgi:beta-galactosidase GanA
MKLFIIVFLFIADNSYSQISRTTPEQKVKREEARKCLSELKSLIETAKKKNIDTLKFESVVLVSELGLEKRWLLPYHDEKRIEYCEWVIKNCKESIEKLKGIIVDRYKPEKILQWPERKNLLIKNGYFYNEDEPVLFFGMNGGSNVDKFFFQKEIDAGVSAVGGTRYNFQSEPIWEVYQKYPETHRVWGGGWCGHIIKDVFSIGGTGECVICLESPYTREAVVEYIKKYLPKVTDEIKIINMGYEYYYICYCNYTKKMFQEWLKRKYIDIGKLNNIWKTTYKDFVEVTLPPMKGEEENDAKWFDFAEFNCFRFTEYLKWAKTEMRKIAPDKYYCAGAPFYYFTGELGKSGIGVEDLNEEVNDVILNESGASTITTDLLWSLGNGKKLVYDPEYHGDIAHIYAHFLHGDGYISMWWWPNSPVMDPPSFYASDIPHSYKISLDDVLLTLNIGMDIRRIGKFITKFPKAALSAEIGLLYSKSSLLQVPKELRNSRSTPYVRELRETYDATLYLDTFTRIVTEKHILEGYLNSCKVLILPGVSHLPQEVFNKLLKFVEDGGVLVLIPNSLIFDEYNRPRDYLKEIAGIEIVSMKLPKIKVNKETVDVLTKDEGFIMGPSSDVEMSDVKKSKIKILKKDIFGDSIDLEGQGVVHKIKTDKNVEVIGEFLEGGSAITVNKIGKGKVYYLATPLEKNSLWVFLDNLIKDANIDRSVRIVDKEGKVIFGVESRTVKENGVYFTYIINFTGEDKNVKISSKESIKKITNLITEEITNKLEFLIKPNETLILKME